jgi:hypothetical protein
VGQRDVKRFTADVVFQAERRFAEWVLRYEAWLRNRYAENRTRQRDCGLRRKPGRADCRDQGGPGVSARYRSDLRWPAVEPPIPVVDGGWRLGDAAAMVLYSRIRATFRVDGHTK